MRSSLSGTLEIDFKNSLVGLKDHSIVHLVVLVQVQPGSVRAWFAIGTIGEDPTFLLRRKVYACLALREQFIIDSNVAVWRSSNCNALVGVLALLVVVNFTGAGPAENLKFKLN